MGWYRAARCFRARHGIAGLAPGEYWVSTLNLDANAGDTRLSWDAPVTIRTGETTRVELTNLNAVEAHVSAP